MDARSNVLLGEWESLVSRIASQSMSEANASDSASEIRTFMIADVRGYTRFSQEHGDAAAARLTVRFAEIATEAVEAGGGQVVELRGDEVLAVFGSARRAIRAAVELQEVLADEADAALPLYAGVGLDAGEAVAVGDGYRGRALNLAARLCSRAVAGEVLATAEAVHLAGTVNGVAYRNLGPIEVKGVERPVEVVSVSPSIEASQRFVSPAAPVRAELPLELDPAVPLIGRERELRRLRWLWRRARHGGRCTCLVWGATGIGKTRLMAELAGEVAQAGWRITYVPGAAAHETAAELLVETRLAAEPTLLIVDDLDACDRAVLTRIEAITSESAVRPLMLVATSRTESTRSGKRLIDPGTTDRIELPPLDDREVAGIAALYLGSSQGIDVPPEVLKEARGVPALVHRLVSEWANATATDRITEAVSAAADGRPKLAVAEADIASRVTDLKWARERSRLYLGGGDRSGGICPFKGLAPYGPEDAEYFFGRERLVAELTARVVGAPFLGVVGPSGSGKSSAVKAGLIPALALGVLPGSDQWPLVVLRPGEHPTDVLAEVSPVTSAGEARGVLVVDQFEETFTICQDEAERRRFVASISELAKDPARLVVVAVRADYVGRCAGYPELARLFGENTVLVGPMDADELSRAIELPAQRAGLSVEPELRDALVSDVVNQPGALPLLSTKLLELWQLRDGRTLTFASYRESGGVEAAIAGLAESAYAKLSPEQQSLARGILLRLAVVDAEGAARRRAALSEFETATDQDAARVLEVFTDARLLITSEGHIEVAHEALLREWPRLRDWLREDAEGTQLHQHLIQAARDWSERDRDRGELYRGARLSAALDWTGSHDPALNQLERDFLDASRDAHQRELRRLRLLLGGAAVLLCVALVAGAVAYVQRGSAQRAATLADAERLGAEAQLQPHLDLALLLARAGADIKDAPETRSNLLATLLRSPQALIVRHVPADWTAGPDQLTLSPDGKTLAIGRDDGHIEFFDSRNLHSTRTIRPPGNFTAKNGVSTIAYSRDGSLIAAGNNRGTIVLLNAKTLRQVGAPMTVSHVGGLIRLVFSPDGHTLAVGYARLPAGAACGGAYYLTRFAVPSGRELPPTVDISGAHPCVDGIDKLFYSPSGDQLLATDWAGGVPRLGKVVAYGATDLHLIHTYPAPRVTGAVFRPDGNQLAVTHDDGTLDFMSYPSGSIRPATDRVTPIWAAEYTPDGRTLITTSDDHTGTVWDVATGTKTETLVGHTDIVPDQALSPDGETLYTGSADGTIIKWDLGGRGSLLRQTITFSPAYPAVIYTNPQPSPVAVSQDGKLLALSPGAGRVQVWSLRTLRTVGPVLRGFHNRDSSYPAGGAQDLAFSPDGRLVAAGGDLGSTLVIWNRQTGQIIRHLPVPVTPACKANPLGATCPGGAGLEFSPDGGTLAAGQGANAALLWNLHSEIATKLPVRHNDWILNLAYGQGGARLITSTGNGHGTLWDVRSRRPIKTFPVDHANLWGPSGIGVSRDGSTFAYGWNSAIVIRNTSTGDVIGNPIPVPSGYGGSIALSPDGQTVAITAGDGVELWDATTGKQIGTPLPGAPQQTSNPGGPGNLRFTPDGRRLIIVSPTGQVTIWNLTLTTWERQACQIAGRDITRAEWANFIPDRGYQSVCR
jgi:WD40 repeat protein/class 3 adenylate cyclase